MADNLSNSIENRGMKTWVLGMCCYADAINQKIRRICPVCQSIRMGLELGNVRSDALFSSFLDSGKATDKCVHSSKSKHCTMEELVDFIQLVSVDGKEIHYGRNIKSLQLHKLDFLKDFIIFSASRGVRRDDLQELLAHTRVMVIAAASCSYMLWKPQVVDGTTRSLIYSQYSEMLKVLPVIILKTSRSSGFFVDGDDLLEAFFNSLLEKHPELLASILQYLAYCNIRDRTTVHVLSASSSRLTVSVVKILIKELRSLRNQRPEGVDLGEEIANLFSEVVSEAAMLFYAHSLDDLEEETELGLSNWMDKVQFLKHVVTKKYLETSTYKFLRTDELGSVLMAPKLSDSTQELPDSTRKLSDSTHKLLDLIDILRSYRTWLKDFLPSTCDLIELRLIQRICSCLEMFFGQDLTSKSDDQSLESFLDFLGLTINEKAWEIFSVIQEIRKANIRERSGGYVNRRPIRQKCLIIICSSNFRHVAEILKPFLFGKALDKYMQSAQSKHCSMKELLDFIKLVLEDGKTIHRGSSLKSLLLHKLEFLKIIISFAASQGVGPDKLQDLLAHTKVIVTMAAYYSYMLWKPEVTDLTTRHLIYSRYFSMLNDGDSYVRVRKALGSSCSLDYTKMDYNMVGLFINSLLESYLELLASESSSTDSFMEILIEELRFLRNFFIYKRQEGGNVDEEMTNLILDVVCEAGISLNFFKNERQEGGNLDEEMTNLILDVFCEAGISHSWDNPGEVPNKETKIGLSNWMEKVQLLNENIMKKYPETSRYKFPKTDELGFMDGLLEDLKELIRYKPDSIAFAQGQLDVVLEDLVFLRDFLRDVMKQCNEHKELKALWFRVIDVAYRSEFVINSLVVGDPSPDCSPTSFNTIKEEIKKMRIDVKEIYMEMRFQIEAFNTPKISNHLPSRSSNPTMNEVVVGFDNQAKEIIDRLEANSVELDIVSIVGMPGGGKTTLAKKVYNDIRSHFHVCAWCCVSQEYQKRKLLLNMLSDSLDKLPTGVNEKSDEDLEKDLYQALRGRRYLIVLDDVWDTEAWCDLQSSFPNDQNQSRILITSRIHLQVNPESEPHFLRPLNDDESRELLQTRLRHNKGCHEKIQNFVVDVCKGLPFAVVTVAGILETLKQDCWEEFAKDLSTTLVSGTEECTELLQLSYLHLPDYLKPCLLYFGSFLQDEEIQVSRLIWLWIAEGFVQKTTDEKSLENVAEDYLKDLINRSLVMVVKPTSRGGIKACSVHDLVHQFCVTRAKEENFLQLLDLQQKTSPLSEPRRLCIYSWEGVQCFRRLSSLKFFPNKYCTEVSSILCSCKILKVLDSRGISSIFPTEVEMLVHLRFLALDVGYLTSIPSTIVKLWNLETFLLRASSKEISLPYSLLNMAKLRHVRVSSRVDFSTPEPNFEKCLESSNLETFSTPILYSGQDMVKIIRKLPYLRKLKCIFFQSLDSKEVCQFGALNFLSQLESLKVHSTGKVQRHMDLSFSLSLKKLTLSNFYLPWSSISTFAKLPNLEVLKLNRACEGETWDMEAEEKFKKLRFLKFENLGIVHWNACSDNFPCLQHLVLHRCWFLQEISSSVGEVDTLEIVEVKLCHSSVVTWAQDLIEESEGFKAFIQMH